MLCGGIKCKTMLEDKGEKQESGNDFDWGFEKLGWINEIMKRRK